MPDTPPTDPATSQDAQQAPAAPSPAPAPAPQTPSHGVQADIGADDIARGGLGAIGDRAAALAKDTLAAIERDPSAEAADLRAALRLHGAHVSIVIAPTV